MIRRPLPRSAAELVQEATDAFRGLDELVAALEIDADENGERAIDLMSAELRRRAAKFPQNAVVQSTAAGLERAYRLSILQSVIDRRLNIQRKPVPRDWSRRRASNADR